MRHRLSRILLSRAVATTKWEKVVLVLPFVVLIVDMDIFYYAITNKATSIILSSGFVLALSIIEIFAAIGEIQEHITHNKRDSVIEERVSDVVKKFSSEPTVRQVMEKIDSDYPEEKFSRYELYPVVCDVLNELFPRRDKRN
ncbi:MAG: hypothetical protein GWP10_11115 [Nitrospiraceae bacterium]|nr:hypothetical protein [Nitrospiraceae bacterium]